MKLVHTVADVRAARSAFLTLGLVPTMGALHEGHLTLIKQARQENDAVAASIFVNPTQFNEGADFDRYPRTLKRDLELLEPTGCDLVFAPDAAAIYPPGFASSIDVGPVAAPLEGAMRPGHFAGVATVVCKLLNIVQPTRAYFGQKDAQQLAVIRRMAADLDLPCEIVAAATVREADGLAMSSRNQRLTPAMREKALGLPRGLALANLAYKNGERTSLKLIEIVANELLVHEGVDLDYCDVVKLAGFSEAEHAGEGCILAVAAFVDGVRLIDHVYLGAGDPVAVDGEGD